MLLKALPWLSVALRTKSRQLGLGLSPKPLPATDLIFCPLFLCLSVSEHAKLIPPHYPGLIILMYVRNFEIHSFIYSGCTGSCSWHSDFFCWGTPALERGGGGEGLCFFKLASKTASRPRVLMTDTSFVCSLEVQKLPAGERTLFHFHQRAAAKTPRPPLPMRSSFSVFQGLAYGQ